MRHILIIYLLFSLGCSTTDKINRHLRLSKKHLFLAQALGAKMDSVKTVIHDTVTIDKIHDHIVKETKIDTVKLKELCPEVKTPTQKKSLQKVVCPDVLKDTTYTLFAKVQGKKYPLRIHIIASSIQGTASLQIDSKDLDIPFTKESVQVNTAPANLPRWYEKLGNNILWFIAGALAMFILGIVKKIVKLGV